MSKNVAPQLSKNVNPQRLVLVTRLKGFMDESIDTGELLGVAESLPGPPGPLQSDLHSRHFIQ